MSFTELIASHTDTPIAEINAQVPARERLRESCFYRDMLTYLGDQRVLQQVHLSEAGSQVVVNVWLDKDADLVDFGGFILWSEDAKHVYSARVIAQMWNKMYQVTDVQEFHVGLIIPK